jgi:hypothetical protein
MHDPHLLLTTETMAEAEAVAALQDKRKGLPKPAVEFGTGKPVPGVMVEHYALPEPETEDVPVETSEGTVMWPEPTGRGTVRVLPMAAEPGEGIDGEEELDLDNDKEAKRLSKEQRQTLHAAWEQAKADKEAKEAAEAKEPKE